MKTVLLDSSVWMSLLIDDTHTKRAAKLLRKVKKSKSIIYVPIIVYAEVINAIIKVNPHPQMIAYAKQLLLSRKLTKILIPGKNFWIKKFEKYSQKVKLKAFDMLILSFAFEYKADRFYTFDTKLGKAHNFIRNSV
jgi:predicted nucleic acid-binding protein